MVGAPPLDALAVVQVRVGRELLVAAALGADRHARWRGGRQRRRRLRAAPARRAAVGRDDGALARVARALDIVEGEPQVAVDLLRVVQAAAALAAHVVRRLRRGARAEVEQAAEGRATRAREETVAVAVGVAGRGVGAGKVEGLRVRLLVHAGQLLEELGRRVGRVDLRQHEERGQHFRRRKVVPPLKTAPGGAFLALANRPPPGPPLPHGQLSAAQMQFSYFDPRPVGRRPRREGARPSPDRCTARRALSDEVSRGRACRRRAAAPQTTTVAASAVPRARGAAAATAAERRSPSAA